MNKNTIPIQIKTLTPVHIGSGNDLKGNFEYVYFADDGEIAVIDTAKILDIIGTNNIDLWVNVIENEQNLLDNLPQLKNVTVEAIAQRIISIYKIAPNPDKNTIKEQLHLGNQEPTIPGSSLKGSIRTAILTKLIKDKPYFVQKKKNLGSQKGSYMKYHDKQIVANYMGKENRTNRFGELQPSPNKDMMRFFRISDFYFDRETTVVKNTVINLFNQGWGEKKRESAYWECIPKNAIAQGNIQIPKDLIRRVQDESYITSKDYNIDILEVKRIFRILNQHTANLLDKEIDFWSGEDDPIAIGDYMNQLKGIKTTIENIKENSCIIRVGASSGWEFMTGGWASGKDNIGDFILDDEKWADLKRQLRKKTYDDDMIFPKTRKMIDGGTPLGFVQLLINDVKHTISTASNLTSTTSKPSDLPPVIIKSTPIESIPSVPIKEVVEKQETSKIIEPKPIKLKSTIPIKETIKKTVLENQTDFKTINKSTVFYAEIIKVERPFSTVKLLLDNYPFELIITMSGTKKAQKKGVKVGDAVKVIISSQTSDGEIKQVKYMV